jgi:hypothetical protein
MARQGGSQESRVTVGVTNTISWRVADSVRLYPHLTNQSVGCAKESRLTLRQPDRAIARAIGGPTRFQVVCQRRGFPRSRAAGYAGR